MIKVRRSRAGADLHAHFHGGKLVKKLITLAGRRLVEGPNIDFKSTYGDWKKTKARLKKESGKKCCYCETPTSVSSWGDVEHFRPSSKYWWLALCIDNFVYSCQICNQGYKGDDFPIRGAKLTEPPIPALLPTTAAGQKTLADRICPDPTLFTDAQIIALWADEDADLLHPYLEDPEPLLEWAVVVTNEEVLIHPAAGRSQRARRVMQAAIDHLGLNREELKQYRYTIYLQLELFIRIWKRSRGINRTYAAEGVQLLCRATASYAGMCRYFARKYGFPL